VVDADADVPAAAARVLISAKLVQRELAGFTCTQLICIAYINNTVPAKLDNVSLSWKGHRFNPDIEHFISLD
jgi:hypothetical protein